MGGRGGSFGGGSKNNFSDFKKSLRKRFKSYDYGGKLICKIGNGQYTVHDFNDPRVKTATDTMIMITKTLKDEKLRIYRWNAAEGISRHIKSILKARKSVNKYSRNVLSFLLLIFT